MQPAKTISTNQVDDDVIITKVFQIETKLSKRKRRCLDEEEMSVIKKHCCLTDLSINYPQNMLHEQFPLFEGLEDTVLGPLLQFSVPRGEFVQVLHDGKFHWVCVSNVGCQKGEVNYFDSLFHGCLTLQTKKQIDAILNEMDEHIIVNTKPVQQQTNGVDCGPYSIAFATSILNNEDPCYL